MLRRIEVIVRRLRRSKRGIRTELTFFFFKSALHPCVPPYYNTTLCHTYTDLLGNHFNLFKKLSLASTTASRQLRNLLQAFPTVSLFKFVNITVNFAFSSSLALHGVLVNRASHVIKQIAILGVRQSDVRSDMVADNTGFLCLCGMMQSLIARRRVFLKPTFQYRSIVPSPGI